MRTGVRYKGRRHDTTPTVQGSLNLFFFVKYYVAGLTAGAARG
jgi:hypothetical protein